MPCMKSTSAGLNRGRPLSIFAIQAGGCPVLALCCAGALREDGGVPLAQADASAPARITLVSRIGQGGLDTLVTPIQ